MKTINIIDRTYLLMSSLTLSLDEFCNWIYNQRTIWNKELSKETVIGKLMCLISTYSYDMYTRSGL